MTGYSILQWVSVVCAVLGVLALLNWVGNPLHTSAVSVSGGLLLAALAFWKAADAWFDWRARR